MTESPVRITLYEPEGLADDRRNLWLVEAFHSGDPVGVYSRDNRATAEKLAEQLVQINAADRAIVRAGFGENMMPSLLGVVSVFSQAPLMRDSWISSASWGVRHDPLPGSPYRANGDLDE